MIPNDNLHCVTEEKLTFQNALALADSVLAQTVQNIVEVIQRTAVVNCDFAGIRSVIRGSGRMHTATGIASGADKADAVIAKITSSRLLGTSVVNANGALLCITAPKNVGLDEIEQISKAISEKTAPDANIIFGMDFDEQMEDEIKAVLIATHPRRTAP